jgi:hypothetical protein
MAQDIYSKDPKRFDKQFNTPLAQKMEERTKIVGGEKLQEIQKEVANFKQNEGESFKERTF